jgi:CBS domain-containing protein
MKVREIMSTMPVTLRSDQDLTQAAHVMRDNDIGDVLVCDDGKLVGIVTDRDIVVRALAEDRDPRLCRVGDICSRDPVTVSPDDDADDAVAMMKDHAVRRVPVCENGRPVGVISLGDVANPRTVLGQISSAPPNQ